uniref:RNA binding motif protein 25a n=1 Tax=Cyprinus carpio TaxID=7962 RepID=A0A8C1J7N1_CYPCA
MATKSSIYALALISSRENYANETFFFLQTKEAKRLKEFLEDYDDDRDDPKYYRGSALQKRLRDREKELELDERDRKREKDELEEIRQRLLAEGHPDPDAELQRVRMYNNITDREEDEEEEEDDREVKPCLKPTLRPVPTAPSISSASGNATPLTPGSESPHGITSLENSSHEAPPTEELRPKIGLSLKLGAAGSPKLPQAGRRKALAAVDSVFNKFDEEEAEEAPKKRKLVPLDYSEDERGGLSLDGTEVTGSRPGVNTEEKRKHIKSLIEKIPTVKQELFNYQLDWNMVDTTLMDRRIRPWINKKIIEYIGEEEATLVDFVCSKVMAHSTPEGILDDVAMVLDEEAEVFIVKMWRLLIYETEAKKIGLVK